MIIDDGRLLPVFKPFCSAEGGPNSAPDRASEPTRTPQMRKLNSMGVSRLNADYVPATRCVAMGDPEHHFGGCPAYGSASKLRGTGVSVPYANPFCVIVVGTGLIGPQLTLLGTLEVG